jgi:hypothetical protein
MTKKETPPDSIKLKKYAEKSDPEAEPEERKQLRLY